MLSSQVDELRSKIEALAHTVERDRPSGQAKRARHSLGTLEREIASELMESLPDEGMSAAVIIGLALGNRHSGWQLSETSDVLGSEGDVGEAARIFSALGNEMRLRLLQLLWDGERTTQDLTDGTGLTQGAVYHHMRELTAFRWVESPRRNAFRITPAGRQALACTWEFSKFLSIQLKQPDREPRPAAGSEVVSGQDESGDTESDF